MERLTHTKLDMCEFCDDIDRCGEDGQAECTEYQLYKRLKAYEATGLTPEEITALVSERDQYKAALADMRLAYLNKDADVPHQFEIEALEQAKTLLQNWHEDGVYAPEEDRPCPEDT